MPSLALAQDIHTKRKVKLEAKSSSISGGGSREKKVDIEFSKGFDDDPIPTADKIKALKQKISFYLLMTKHKVDLEKSISKVYTDKSLSKVLDELAPEVPIKFEGVDRKVTVMDMTLKQVQLDRVFDFLDQAAGVYFSYSEQGILITNELRK
jgi:hypothetical protein